jgi:two-component system NtrC family sensor kinase
MAINAEKKGGSLPDSLPYNREHYRELKRRQIIRLLFTYLGPLIILIIFFSIQYGGLVSESHKIHLSAIAENQSNTLNLFLSERIVNLDNLIDDPRFPHPPTSTDLQTFLTRLKRNSKSFADVGYFDSAGVQTAYAGPYPSLEKRNYSSEAWYTNLKNHDENYIITDIYLGFRQVPHFTIAVSRIINGQFIVLRATLDPAIIYEYMRSLEGANEVFISIVNKAGYYQLVTPHIGTPLESSSIVPPQSPRLGAEKVRIDGSSITYAYSWLRLADWALIVQPSSPPPGGFFSGLNTRLLIIAAAMIILIILVILFRANKLVEMQMEADRTRAQLEHASKLASVGELAAGIAHEINNPLAVINEEAGLIRDYMNPEFGKTMSHEQLQEHLDTIRESVFRCRDITHKLLRFVRKSDIELKMHDIHKIIDAVLDGFLIREMAVSNIEIEKKFSSGIPAIQTDSNQLQQVILNMINNAVDAMEGHAGKIVITTAQDNGTIKISIADNGKGIKPADMDKLFIPFFTTKEVGKGTGLGLSVSYGIIKSLGGHIEVDSKVGQGSTFTIVLPFRPGKL